ncbi:sialate O-acetylesterase [Maribellus maritimus]|uniref:sialate O-acetylesterase n=1 Tax=Maribellus maritimus TaxID=2870838 RepID=UPI001EEC17E8|nr:sialate O-acetylesterase [Maribellus maritimus]
MLANALNKKYAGVLAIAFILLIFSFQKSEGQISREFSLPLWISDDMIFPSETNWILKGSCGPFQEVSVSFDNIKISTKSDKDGLWEINFPSVKPGIFADMVFVCNGETKVIKEVLSGNIWLCAGQSNMAIHVKSSKESIEAGEDLFSSDIRYFNGKQWQKVTSENVQSISAVAFFFAAEMERRRKKPIGIFVAARGGTGIEAWVPEEAFPDNETGNRFSTLVNDPLVLKAAKEDEDDMKPYGQHRLAKWGLGRAVPATLFNRLIRPFGQLPLTGVVWYQGESNTDNVSQATEYRFWLKNLISSYRKHFDKPDLPFAIIQLPVYDPGTTESLNVWKILQDVQATVAQNTSYTVSVDIQDLGELHNIHPVQKKEVGIRTAKAVCKLISIN